MNVFAQTESDSLKQVVINYEIENLKRYAFCMCLYKANPDAQYLKQEPSASEYFVKGIIHNVIFEKVDSLATKYVLEKAKMYFTADGEKEIIEMCFDFYNGKDLNEFLTSFDGNDNNFINQEFLMESVEEKRYLIEKNKY